VAANALHPVLLMPLVTAVIPTYNRLPLLMEAVASVRAQTLGDWELVVVDDGSADGSAEAVEALGDARIRVLRLPPTGNVAALRNAGVRAGSGDWVAFLDSDDVWEPRKLQAQLGALHAAGARWSYTDLRMMDDAGEPIPMHAGEFRPLSGSIVRELLTEQTTIAISTVMVSRELLDQVGGFHEAQPLREDMDLELRLAERAPTVAVDEPLTRMREHAGRTTASEASPHELSCAAYERFLARERDPALRCLACERLARLLSDGAAYEAAHGRPDRAAAMLRRAQRYVPPPVP
jgi:glycosyltransferase involved in cell wall biosynthesis